MLSGYSLFIYAIRKEEFTTSKSNLIKNGKLNVTASSPLVVPKLTVYTGFERINPLNTVAIPTSHVSRITLS